MGQNNDLAFRIGAGIRKYLARTVANARRLIFELGLGIASTAIDDLLKETSSVPTEVSTYAMFNSLPSFS